MNVYFEPWIGENYQSKQPKILVVGDSHYCGECETCGIRGSSISEMSECAGITQNTVKDYLSYRQGKGDYANWMTKTYLPFDKVYYGKEDVTPKESLDLWNNIAFYNFVQTAISNKASNSEYSDDDYGLSSPMATEVINTLEPDYIIVWGNRAYEALSDKNWTHGSDEYNGTYKLPSGRIAKCIRIYHPSRANVEQWHSALSEFIK